MGGQQIIGVAESEWLHKETADVQILVPCLDNKIWCQQLEKLDVHLAAAPTSSLVCCLLCLQFRHVMCVLCSARLKKKTERCMHPASGTGRWTDEGHHRSCKWWADKAGVGTDKENDKLRFSVRLAFDGVLVVFSIKKKWNDKVDFPKASKVKWNPASAGNNLTIGGALSSCVRVWFFSTRLAGLQHVRETFSRYTSKTIPLWWKVKKTLLTCYPAKLVITPLCFFFLVIYNLGAIWFQLH